LPNPGGTLRAKLCGQLVQGVFWIDNPPGQPRRRRPRARVHHAPGDHVFFQVLDVVAYLVERRAHVALYDGLSRGLAPWHHATQHVRWDARLSFQVLERVQLVVCASGQLR